MLSTDLNYIVCCRDLCVLEGLAALLGMQVTPLLPLLKRSARRGAPSRGPEGSVKQGVAASGGSGSCSSMGGGLGSGSNSNSSSFKRRSSEFVLTIVRKSASFR